MRGGSSTEGRSTQGSQELEPSSLPGIKIEEKVVYASCVVYISCVVCVGNR